MKLTPQQQDVLARAVTSAEAHTSASQGDGHMPGSQVLLSVDASQLLREWWAQCPSGGFGLLLRELRCAAGLTQEVVAAASSVSQGQLSRYESGEGALPDAGALASLIVALGASPAATQRLLTAAAKDRALRAGRG